MAEVLTISSSSIIKYIKTVIKMNGEETFQSTNVEEIARGPRKRQTAFKLKIADLNNSHVSNGLVEINGKKVSRVNIIANVVDKFNSEGESRFCSLTIDDASSQIRIKAFGEDIGKISDLEIGDTALVIGNTRFYNDELYILPEIAKNIPLEWLVIRKLELDKNPHFKISSKITEEKIINKEDVVRQKIKMMLQQNVDGIDIDRIIMEIKHPIEEINSAVSDMIEQAEIYEPKPGKIRLL